MNLARFCAEVGKWEADWRPLPSCAETLAHSARTGGNGLWLCDQRPDDTGGTLRVMVLAAWPNGAVVSLGGDEHVTANPAAHYRPVTRRGEALPWPEVPR